MDLALIDVWPFRSSAEEDSPLVAPPDDYGFFSNDIGGVVHGELNITEGEEPYVVKRSIYVDGYVVRRKQLQFPRNGRRFGCLVVITITTIFER